GGGAAAATPLTTTTATSSAVMPAANPRLVMNCLLFTLGRTRAPGAPAAVRDWWKGWVGRRLIRGHRLCGYTPFYVWAPHPALSLPPQCPPPPPPPPPGGGGGGGGGGAGGGFGGGGGVSPPLRGGGRGAARQMFLGTWGARPT